MRPKTCSTARVSGARIGSKLLADALKSGRAPPSFASVRSSAGSARLDRFEAEQPHDDNDRTLEVLHPDRRRGGDFLSRLWCWFLLWRKRRGRRAIDAGSRERPLYAVAGRRWRAQARYQDRRGFDLQQQRDGMGLLRRARRTLSA